MKRAEYGVHLLGLGRGNKISPVHETIVSFPLYEDSFQIIHQILLHFMVKLYGNTAEAVSDVTVMQHLVEITV